MDRDLSRSKAVLIGNATYRADSGIAELPSASACVAAMAELLHSDLCGWPADRIVRLVDVATPSALARRLIIEMDGVSDTLLVYYVGHGLRSVRGQLVLTLADSDSDHKTLGLTGMVYEELARLLAGSNARTKLVILDCCHAELANSANYVFQSAGADLAELYPVEGLYFIGASKRHEKALSPVGDDLTYFTDAFINVVQEGIVGQPATLRLDQIFVELRRHLMRRQLPEPVESGMKGARQYPFARNAVPAGAHLETDDPRTARDAIRAPARVWPRSEGVDLPIVRVAVIGEPGTGKSAFIYAAYGMLSRGVGDLKACSLPAQEHPDWAERWNALVDDGRMPLPTGPDGSRLTFELSHRGEPLVVINVLDPWSAGVFGRMTDYPSTRVPYQELLAADAIFVVLDTSSLLSSGDEQGGQRSWRIRGPLRRFGALLEKAANDRVERGRRVPALALVLSKVDRAEHDTQRPRTELLPVIYRHLNEIFPYAYQPGVSCLVCPISIGDIGVASHPVVDPAGVHLPFVWAATQAMSERYDAGPAKASTWTATTHRQFDDLLHLLDPYPVIRNGSLR